MKVNETGTTKGVDGLSCFERDGLEYFDSGVNKYVIGLPTQEQKVALKADGYFMMSRGEYEDGSGKYEIWLK